MISVVNNLPNTVYITDGQTNPTLKKGEKASVKAIRSIKYDNTTLDTYDMSGVPASTPAQQKLYIAQMNAYGISDINKSTLTCLPNQPISSGMYSTDMKSKIEWAASCSGATKTVTLTLNGTQGIKTSKKLSPGAIAGIVVAILLALALVSYFIYDDAKRAQGK